MDSNLDRLYDLIDDIEVAMLTTRRADGRLVSRPMATQVRAAGADLWFVTVKSSPKIEEIAANAQVNLSYFKDRTREWISVSGTARAVDDRDKIRELYRPDWRAWFEDKGGAENGGPDDPRIVLIGVDIAEAHYMELNKPMPVILYGVVKGMITGHRPDMPPVRTVEK